MEHTYEKKLRRSNTDRVFAGVCGGIGEYFGIDSTVIRVACIIIIALSGIFPGIVGYIIAVFVIPEGKHG